MFSTHPIKNFWFLSYIYIVICKCSELDQFKNLSFGKELTKEELSVTEA